MAILYIKLFILDFIDPEASNIPINVVPWSGISGI